MVQVTLPNGKQRELRVAGFVEDRTTDSANGNVYGYVNLDTMEYLGRRRSLNLVEMTVADNAGDKAHVRDVARLVEDQFRHNGGQVSSTMVREPGKHPNASKVNAITALLAALGLLTICLSAFLVINTVSALMSQQVRHIGVMKAVGARTGQIFGMYVVLLLCLGLGALLIAAPLALGLGYFATTQIAAGLNFTISPFRPEPLPIVLMTVLSLAVPVLAGLAPVLGARAPPSARQSAGMGWAECRSRTSWTGCWGTSAGCRGRS